VKFWHRANDAAAWTQLGATVTQAFIAPIVTNTTVLQVGCDQGGGTPMQGKLYRVAVYAGIGGTLVAEFKPQGNYTTGTTFVASTGETWTGQAGAIIAHDGMTAFSTTASNKTLVKSGGGTVNVGHIALQRSTGSPASTFYAGGGSFNVANNVDWTFGTPVEGAGTANGASAVDGYMNAIARMDGESFGLSSLSNAVGEAIWNMQGLSEGVAFAEAEGETALNTVDMVGLSEGLATVEGFYLQYPKSRVFKVPAEARMMNVLGVPR
jgi:hypothetical protein